AARGHRLGPSRVTATVLSIAGVDSGGGAGVAADIKTITAHGCWALCAITAVTAQDTTGVHGCLPVEPSFVVAQIGRVGNDIGAVTRLEGARRPSPHTHGTGCVLSAAIAARLALGDGLEDAVDGARAYVREAIAKGLSLGRGTGPVNPPPTTPF